MSDYRTVRQPSDKLRAALAAVPTPVLMGELRTRLEAHRQARAALARPQDRDQVAEAVHSLIRARQNVRYAMEACQSTEDRLTQVIEGLRTAMPEVSPEIWKLVEHLADRPERQDEGDQLRAVPPPPADPEKAADFNAALEADADEAETEQELDPEDTGPGITIV
jgi:hypothetical protein